MKKGNFLRIGIILLLCLLFSGNVLANSRRVSEKDKLSHGRPLRILFVGNSKTYFPEKQERLKGIPYRFQNMMMATGKKTEITYAVRNGASLIENCKEKKKLIRRPYDVVIIQECTLSYAGSYDDFLNGAMQVAQMVRDKNPIVKLILRAPWLTTTSSQEEKKAAYENARKVGAKIKADVIYEGILLDMYLKKYPHTKMFVDEKHQNKNLAYFSALCIYKAVTDEYFMESFYYGGCTRKNAKRMQRFVKFRR